MTDYENYVTSINKIFEYIQFMKEKWPNQDNQNYIEQIEEFKKKIVETSEIVKNKHNDDNDIMEEVEG